MRNAVNQFLSLCMLSVWFVALQSNASMIYWYGSSDSENVDGWRTLVGTTIVLPLDEGYLVSLYEWEADGGENGYGFSWDQSIADTTLYRAPADWAPWQYYFWCEETITIPDNTDLITVIYNSTEFETATWFMICDQSPFNSGSSLVATEYYVSIPEPATVLLLGLGGLGAWLLRRNRVTAIEGGE
jgi:hypothetical protein